MQKFHIKSIILGIGMGIVLTSIISMIYIAGVSPEMGMSKEEIIEQAIKYGMVDKSELIKDSGTQSGESSDNKKTDNTPAPKPSSSPASENHEVSLSINPGDTSEVVAERLLKAELISDKAAFKKKLDSMGLASQIDIGQFKIKKGTDMEHIIRIITGM